jgi:RNA polymerase sigma-70 factor (ECF subfamily)
LLAIRYLLQKINYVYTAKLTKNLINSEVHNDEDDLIQRFQDGEEAAFTVFFQRYHQRLYFFAQRFVETADAKDAVSEAFAQLWQKRGDFEREGALSHFLFVAVRNRCLNMVRHQLVRHNKQAEILHLLEQSDESELEREALISSLVDLIYKEIDQLPPRLREIFLLSFREGLKPAQIAERLGIGVQTVKNKKLAAIRLMQAALGSRGPVLSLLLLLWAVPGPITPYIQ